MGGMLDKPNTVDPSGRIILLVSISRPFHSPTWRVMISPGIKPSCHAGRGETSTMTSEPLIG